MAFRHFKQDRIVAPVALFLAMGQPCRAVRRRLAPLIGRDGAIFTVRLVTERPDEFAVDGRAVADHFLADHLNGITRQAHDPLDHHPARMRVLEHHDVSEFRIARENASFRDRQVASKAERQ